MNGGALHHALETSSGFRVFARHGHQIAQVLVEEIAHGVAQLFDFDIARAHDGDGVRIVAQSEQQVFERGVFVTALGGSRQRVMKGLFQVLRQHRQGK